MSFKHSTYTSPQISAYLSRINFPSIALPTSRNVTSDYGLEYLKRLQKYHMQAVPFENLNMHYANPVIKSLDPQDLYDKIVVRKWGGTCTENNNFFGRMLRSMGFDIRAVGSRIENRTQGFAEPGYAGWNHCVSLATFDGKKYYVDVAMGPTTPSQPLLLEDGYTASGIGATTCRIRYDTIPEYTDPSSKVWIYEQDNDGKSELIPTACFTELEFLPQDYEVMKIATTFVARSWFTFRIVVVRTLLDESENVVGTLILVNNSLKRRIMGKSEDLGTFSCEQERVDALKKWFDIDLNEEDRKGIRLMVTDLGP